MDLEIRLAVASDAEAVSDAHVAAWRVVYRHTVPDSFLDDPRFPAARLAGWRRSPRWRSSWSPAEGELDELWVPVVDGEVVGFALVARQLLDAVPEAGPITAASGERGELHGFYLHPRVWGTGVADTLLEHCHQRLAACFDDAVLWVIAANTRARRFYSRHGWSCGDGADLIEDLWNGPQMSDMPPFGPPVLDVQYRRQMR